MLESYFNKVAGPQALLWKLEILQKLLLLKVFFTYVIKTHNYFFVTVLFNLPTL